jgi:hypothetical protein
MAETLIKYYQYVEKEYGVETKIEVAQESSLPSSKASLEADSQENIETLRTAIEKITGEVPPDVDKR